MSFKAQVAFITGGVTGIGLGVAQAFSDAGLRLALSYRNEDHRARTEAWFAARGREAPLFIKLDVTDAPPSPPLPSRSRRISARSTCW